MSNHLTLPLGMGLPRNRGPDNRRWDIGITVRPWKPIVGYHGGLQGCRAEHPSRGRSEYAAGIRARPAERASCALRGIALIEEPDHLAGRIARRGRSQVLPFATPRGHKEGSGSCLAFCHTHAIQNLTY